VNDARSCGYMPGSQRARKSRVEADGWAEDSEKERRKRRGDGERERKNKAKGPSRLMQTSLASALSSRARSTKDCSLVAGETKRLGAALASIGRPPEAPRLVPRRVVVLG